MFQKVLVANRGVIACRIIRTLHRMGVSAVAVYSEADRNSMHVAQAREAVCIGPPPAAQSYLDMARILDAARSTGAQAIHPGYGFLSENAMFAEACEAAGVVFIGPTPRQMVAFALKHTARELAAAHHVPMLPGSELLRDLAEAREQAARVGYPVMLKSTAGGGGIGMRVCRTEAELDDAYDAVERLGKTNFGQAGLYLERFVAHARHVEVQIFGDGAGHVIALGERDCSAQRRNQKVIEETPAPGLSDAIREQLCDAAIRLGKAVQYRSAGTVEFLFDQDRQEFYFLEVNTRLQVEHGVTEEVTGIDLVEWMVLQAAGELTLVQPKSEGCSIQVRVYAEDAAKDFQPSAGLLSQVVFPAGVRCETWVESGTEVTPFYDPMLAKLIVRADTRAEAVAMLQQELDACELYGLETNLPYLRQVSRDAKFRAGGITTAYLKEFDYRLDALEVVEPGTQTTVQDWPGRLGYWHVGVPPSGPMDSLALRLANRLVGNNEAAAGVECAVTGPWLRFHSGATIALTGADMGATIDGEPAPLHQAVEVRAGSLLRLGHVRDTGSRAYIAIRGGVAVPEYLGSRSTFILGRFGGHAGRVLRAGDVLRWGTDVAGPVLLAAPIAPALTHDWEVGIIYGPHGAPDFFTAGDIEIIFSTAWKVHYNSDRTGVRLIGPKPEWARKDGGEAGLHPSNLHDNAYAIGTMDFTGDMPVLLGPDGPSLGGFVCPATIVDAELWKMGQFKPGDTVRFRRISAVQAAEMEARIEEGLTLPQLPAGETLEPAVIRRFDDVVCRPSGDKYLLIEFGPNLLDLNLRFRVHALEEQLRKENLRGIVDLTPGIRSLQIHYDSRMLPRDALLEAVESAERSLPALDDITLPTRVVHLPLSWDDPATQLAIRKYMQSVRPDAPWCPSNIEFIRRINGLNSIDDVYDIVFNASYLVLGLGDVYLGAPVATPIDPRHRLVTTKYNPARTWTAENSVGIGGAYLCVYGMEGPGGYQFVGRTVQMWNMHRETPWLLRFFDQIRFHPVSAEELLELREAFPHGRYNVRIEDQEFRLRDYHRFLDSIRQDAAGCKARQQAAFDAERERWVAAGQAESFEPVEMPVSSSAGDQAPDGCEAVRSPITASVWQIHVEPGQPVEAGQKLVVLEAMKMEVAVVAPCNGVVKDLRCSPGGLVTAGQCLLFLEMGGKAA